MENEQPAIVGGSLTKEERISLEEYLDHIEDDETDSSERFLRKVSELRELVKNKYAGTTKKLDEILGEFPPRQYKRKYFSRSEPQTGDLCANVDYCIRIPDSSVLRGCFSEEIKENESKSGMAKLIGYTEAVYNKLPHLFDGLDDRSSRAMDVVWDEMSYHKVIRLEDVIRGELPAVCFEQAIALNHLISNDPEIKRLGGKSTIDNGYYMSNKGKFYEHSWVKLTFPRAYPEYGIDSTVYVLDAAFDEVIEYREKCDCSEDKYVRQQDSELKRAFIVILRPK